MIDGWVLSCEIALRWMPLDLTGDKSTLVQVTAWYCQRWPKFIPSYLVTKQQWVNYNITNTSYKGATTTFITLSYIRHYNIFDTGYGNPEIVSTALFVYANVMAWLSACESIFLQLYSYIEAETKWTTFHRRRFQTYFLQWKCLNFD